MHEREELAEEQGWIARMVHLFRAESLDVQFEVRTLFDHGEEDLLTFRFSSCCKRPVVISKVVETGCALRIRL